MKIFGYLCAIAMLGSLANCTLLVDETSVLTENEACAFLDDQSQLHETKIWMARAQCDLIAAHNITMKSHPGVVDPQNTGFVRLLNRTLNNSLQMSKTITGPLQYKFVLNYYTSAFKDGHYQLYTSKTFRALTNSNSSNLRWPEVVAGWRNGKIFVVHAEPGSGLTSGDQLLSCDSRSANALMEKNVFSFSSRNSNNPASWALEARKLLQDRGNPFVTSPKKCVFLRQGKQIDIALEWQEMDQARRRKLDRKSTFGDPPKPALREIRQGIWWVNVSDFNPKDEAASQVLHNLIADIRTHQTELRVAKTVIFDTRGNQGGNSSWGRKILRALYGEEFITWRNYRPETRADWRVNQELVTHLQNIREDIGIKQNNPEIVQWMDELIPGIVGALQRGDDFFTALDEEKIAPQQVQNPVTAKVFLFTDGWCASSCLDFADYAHSLSMEHVGYPTSSDRVYIEARQGDLPSGFGQFILPVKVWRNRMRGDEEFYTPVQTYNEFNWTDEAVQTWFLETVLSE